ncbi:fatty acid desaturase family protein [Sphingobacterium psychroaquaticum]|uniref:Linoleoyl-CoA desaturase n=1 Tax=Sphingobacterium psychroaquaticum TaxID=561061 RepID=A0A1X7I363_9SPHI|nr:acyl-CoA desaturase [Sphingobacterium psychroaquaticum]SMG08907.1 linoleoyl-CoA desaturase [Sphingobacterium psychroaquaticum]
MNPTIKFNNVNTVFSKALKEKANAYFKSTLKDKTGDKRIFTKAAILLTVFFLIYGILVFVQPHWIISVLLCVVFGINFAAIGFNIMHDAGHNSFSSNKKLNTVLSYSLNLLGGNIYFWKLKHNIAHHTYTNIEGEDHDIKVKFMRLHSDQKAKKYHRFQKYYFPLLYSISYLTWIYYQDYEKYFKQVAGIETFHFPLKEKVIFWMTKVIHHSIFIIFPVIYVGWLPTLIGLLISGVVCGLFLAVIFQLAHVVEETEFKVVDTDRVENEWMIHQLKSTANFSTENKVLTWLLGGLNFQIEHHLFPKISHVHYPALNKIVRQTCQEFNINYIEFKSFRSAFLSHVQVIHAMSK